MNEPFLCLDCSHKGPLNLHGYCESCGSNAVDPVARQRTDRDIIQSIQTFRGPNSQECMEASDSRSGSILPCRRDWDGA